MTIDYGSINYVAVLVGIVINMALGALWYSGLAFAGPWMKLTGITREYIEEHKDETYQSYAVAVVASAALVFALAIVIQLTGAASAVDGLALGLYAGIGFVASTYAVTYTFEGRPIRLYLINVGYSVVGFAVIGVLMASWN